ncbi:tyrosine-protein phosphatase 99A-like isoform X3 [Haliotis rufescens]|uniref:tyrosine-protein phosphatase 99A-like isoform X3 n=1 Tax=Haliotis rufescens TaxID=6454 RepID=UPI00201F7347|nr:tyrosine-protein phosphatase 99A-like isoform X3 [Haliotis rufescens]
MIVLVIVSLIGVTVGEDITVHATTDNNVTLKCTKVRGDEKVGGILWYKNGVFFASKGNSKKINFADPAYKDKTDILEDHSLVLYTVKVRDTANYTCKVYVEDSQNASMKERNVTRNLVVQDVPSPPGKPRILNIESREVKVTWDKSASDNNSPISVYILHVSKCTVTQGPPEERDVVVGGSTLEITVRELNPHTCYQVKARAKNGVGRSEDSSFSDMFLTLEEPPSEPPFSVKADSPDSTEVHVQWNHIPKNKLNGELKGYELSYKAQDGQPERVRLEDPTRHNMVLFGLKPFTKYEIQLKAFNSVGSGPPANVTVRTAEGVPTKPRITHITNRMSKSFFVHWEPPKTLNGRLEKYELQWSYNSSSATRIIQGDLNNPMSAFIRDLEPYTEYKIRVAAYTGGGKGKFSDDFPGITDVEGPSAPYITNFTVVGLNSVYIQWEPPDVFYKTINNYFIKWWDVVEASYYEDRLIDGTETETTLEDLPINGRYRLKIAGVTHGIFSKTHYVGEFTDATEFVLGGSQSDISRGVVDTEIIRDHGHYANPEMESAKNKEEVMSAGVIAGVIIAVLISLIVVVIFVGYRSFACRKCYQAAYYYLAVPTNSQSTPPTVVTVAEPADEKVYPDVTVKEFIRHVETLHADSDIGFSQEFDDINKNTNVDFRCESSSLPENRGKNRYINIAAFDHSRVVLKTELGRLRHSDYINANYIDGYQKPKAYIATQGPLPQTFADFWRMIWEQNCSVIVMITNLMERGRRKCDQYWPSDGLEIYGSMSVKLLNTIQRAHYTVRIFSVRNMKKHSVKGVGERLVYQFHYTEWPDHGVPDYTLPCLTFVRKSAEMNPEGGGPIVVHCSAGVGRTGTYILIDSMIAKMEEKSLINIPGFILHIRKQRNFLVQTEDQYMFIHDVLVEYILGGGDTEVTADTLTPYIEKLTMPARDGAETIPEALLENQYKLVTAHKRNDDEISQALKPVNEAKNRNSTFLPVNLKRVLLPVKPGMDGSDYINATYMQGYSKSNEFIVTQHPLESTVEDFWRMVWDRNSPVIIVLSYVNNEDFKEFWPKKEEPMEFEACPFKLTTREEEQVSTCVTRGFLLESTQYDYTFQTKLMTVDGWPGACSPLHTVFQLIETAQKWQLENDIGPVIVVDRYGGVEAGKLCALWTMYNQLTQDKNVDLYQLAKLYHLKRPGIIGTKDDYLFLYKAVESYHKASLEDGGESVNSSPKHHNSVRKNGTLPHTITLSHSNSKTETNI